MIKLLSAISIFLLLQVQAFGEIVSYRSCDNSMGIAGRFNLASPAIYSGMADQVPSDKVYVSSLGGILVAGERIGREIRDRNQKLILFDKCYSSCFYMAMYAKDIYVDSNADFRTHYPYIPEKTEASALSIPFFDDLNNKLVIQKVMTEWATEVGANPEIIDYLLEETKGDPSLSVVVDQEFMNKYLPNKRIHFVEGLREKARTCNTDYISEE